MKTEPASSLPLREIRELPKGAEPALEAILPPGTKWARHLTDVGPLVDEEDSSKESPARGGACRRVAHAAVRLNFAKTARTPDARATKLRAESCLERGEHSTHSDTQK